MKMVLFLTIPFFILANMFIISNEDAAFKHTIESVKIHTKNIFQSNELNTNGTHITHIDNMSNISNKMYNVRTQVIQSIGNDQDHIDESLSYNELTIPNPKDHITKVDNIEGEIVDETNKDNLTSIYFKDMYTSKHIKNYKNGIFVIDGLEQIDIIRFYNDPDIHILNMSRDFADTIPTNKYKGINFNDKILTIKQNGHYVFSMQPDIRTRLQEIKDIGFNTIRVNMFWDHIGIINR